MRAALEEAVQRLKSQQARKGVVLRRLEELQTGFEEASIDKNEQERRGTESARQLSYLDSLEEILHFEHRKHTLSSCAVAERTQGLLGSTAMAAGLLCYLGPYEHLFCQLLLSLEWPKCLRDRGLPFLIDSLDPIKGRVIDFSVEFFKGEGEETEKETDVRADCYQEREKQHQQEEFMEGDGQHLQTPEDAEDTGSFAVDLPAPAISSEHYGDFVKVLLKAIVGDEKILDWEAKDWTLRQMQNAAILLSSWQKPAFLIYPSNEAEKWFKELQGALPHTANTCVQLGEW
ncbi:uncharacterized protein LOC136718521 [Amia ocellicauda]|uniref:uncharacterized protein LOC136718521 n=1 Tax=Amia ocellicauda TaxID=2972642 RepID=UPI0034647B52